MSLTHFHKNAAKISSQLVRCLADLGKASRESSQLTPEGLAGETMGSLAGQTSSGCG